MICPSCHSEVPDGSFECPYCGEPLCATQKIDLDEISWCPVCGALVPAGKATCPKCSSPMPGARAARSAKKPDRERNPDLPAPGLESAIPPTGPGSYTASSAPDVLPRLKQFIVAAGAAVLIVGGTALAITHPWDPSANDLSAKFPFDTSQAGSPDKIDILDSQDKSGSENKGGSQDPIYDSLMSDYESLVSCAERIDASEAALADKGVSGTVEERSQGSSDAWAVSIEVSNTISAIGSTSDGAGAYAETIGNLKTLGNWLRNRCDALTSAWEMACDSSDPAGEEEQILEKISGNSGYKDLFDQNVEGWKPSPATS